MKIKQYDRVLLKDGNKASIVEIFDSGKAFLADVDKNGDTYTEEIKQSEIDKVI
jgi:hypothetical protein